MEGYSTVEREAQDEFVERRSRFIGAIAPVSHEAAALAFVENLRLRHREASHTVYAYILRDGGITRFSDDGEPQGTAGKPVLEVLQREGLTDVAVVVTRYFGGVLLGAGGLVRAYAQGAKGAVDAARRLTMTPAVRAELDIGYDFYGKVTYLLPDYGAVTESSDFGAGVRLGLLLPADRLSGLTERLRELSGGRAEPLVREKLFAHFEGN